MYVLNCHSPMFALHISGIVNDEASADLILRSSDGIRFFVRIRMQDLAAHSMIFTAAGECSNVSTVTKGNDPLDIVDVSEG